jgi:hypothetical protein
VSRSIQEVRKIGQENSGGIVVLTIFFILLSSLQNPAFNLDIENDKDKNMSSIDDYRDNMTLDGWQWEFVRRNELYRNSYEDIRKLSEAPKNSIDDRIFISFYEKGGEEHFHIKVVQNKEIGGTGTPDPTLQYNQLPILIKPIMDEITIEALKEPIGGEISLSFFKKAFTINRLFHTKCFFSKEDYGIGVPDPALGYDQLPDLIKPIMDEITIAKQDSPPLTVKAIRDINLDEELNRTWDDRYIEKLWRSDKKNAFKTLLAIILSPGGGQETLYLGISLRGKRDETLETIKNLTEKYLSPKSKKHPRVRKTEWKSYLDIWDEWEKSKTPSKRLFAAIAETIKINISTVKTRWYKTYFLIYGRKYNPIEVKASNKKSQEELCAKCKFFTCYEQESKNGGHSGMNWVPCAEFLKLGNREEYLRETLKDNNALEFLLAENKKEGARRIKKASTE